MHLKLFAFFILLFLTTVSYAQYLSGYAEEISGETLLYESHQPDAKESLLVRSERKEKYIEWISSSIPENFNKPFAEIILLAGIDVNAEDNHEFKCYINDQLQFSFRNPVDTLTKSWTIEGSSGIVLDFRAVMVDKYGDLFGYIFLRIPKTIYKPGKPVKIKIAGESANSRSWFMVFKYNAVQQVKFIQEKAIIKNGDSKSLLVRVDILNFDEPAEVTIHISSQNETIPIKLGFNMHRMAIPLVTKPIKTGVALYINKELIKEDSLTIYPVEMKSIYLLPHSHIDIGYTHVQDVVKQIQWQNIKDAVLLSEKTKNYPDGARFKWNSEVMWAVDSYLKSCTENEKKELRKAVQEGCFELNGIYANILTGLCKPEELLRMMQSGQEIGTEFNVKVNSAMISDIPGYTWSLVPVMAASGIKYFSIGTNQGHRIGNVIDIIGDKPFYWQSACGNEKILCWVHGQGYSAFHTGLAYTVLRNKLKEQLIFDYLTDLEKQNYPYDIVTLRYNIGSDNGPPDQYLSDIVKSWNEKYISPKLIISTVGDSFKKFEEKYGKGLPVYSGDFTGFWEDGAGSSASETKMNRLSAERLVQAEKLFSLYNSSKYSNEVFNQAWENVLLYSEHTWGSWNSISEPFSNFTLQQWEIKKSFAEKADSLSKTLLISAIQSSEAETVKAIDIYNTNSWAVTDLVALPSDLNLNGNNIKEENGKIISSQRLSSGELVFVATEIPAFGSKRYFIEKRHENNHKGEETDDKFFLHNHVQIDFNETSGAINRLEFRDYPFNFVSVDTLSGLNEYFYISGRNPKNKFMIDESEINVIENGPVLKTFEISSEAPGCNSLIRQIKIIKGIDRIDIKNIVDKKDILEPEGLHFAFPFNIPNGKVRISNAWGYFEVESEQLPAANRNYFSANRWADVSNDNYGITFVPIDAPLIEIGNITTDPIDYGWIDSLPQSQTLFSYIMNNYWETNYKASQHGKVEFNYSIYPHREFDPLQSEKFSVQLFQPLIPIVVDASMKQNEIPFTIRNKNVIIETMKPMPDQFTLVKLYNPGTRDEWVTFEKKKGNPVIYRSDPFGKIEERLDNGIQVKARGLKSVLVK
ncbi:MAG: glycoside hydrolase family 38 C-terminal domain-containing protein [Bacteroidales bacterium]